MPLSVNAEPIFAKLAEMDMSREQLCGRAKVGTETLRKVEQGKLVRLQSLHRICMCLGIKPKDVLTDTAAHGPSDFIANHNSGMVSGMKEEMLEEFVTLLKETTDRETLQGIMQTIKLFRRGSR